MVCFHLTPNRFSITNRPIFTRLGSLILSLSFFVSCMHADKISLDSSNPLGFMLQIVVPNTVSGIGSGGQNGAGSSLQATGGIHSVSLSWSAVSDGSSFKIYSSTSSDVNATSPDITSGGTTASSFVHSALNGGETRFYLLEKILPDGSKSYSSVVQATTYYLPSDVSSLIFWLGADFGVTKDASNLVTNWTDRIGSLAYSNVYASQEPIWVPNYRNQQAFITTSQSASSFFQGPGIPISGSSYTILSVVEQTTADSSSQGMIELTGGGNDLILKFQGGKLLVNNGGGDFQSNAYTTTNAHVMTAQFSASSTSLYINGTLNKTTSNVYPIVGNSIGYIGVYFGGAGFDGKIGEILVYDQGLSAADRIKAECYLGFKYGISVPHSCN